MKLGNSGSGNKGKKYIKIKENSDVLFMYNTSILNNSSIIAKFFR